MMLRVKTLDSRGNTKDFFVYRTVLLERVILEHPDVVINSNGKIFLNNLTIFFAHMTAPVDHAVLSIAVLH